MNEKQLQNELNDLKKGMKLFDTVVNTDYKTGTGKLSKKQVEIVRKLFNVFKHLNWQLSFNHYKEIKYSDRKSIDTHNCGKPVRIRSCRKEHGDKTYFGVLLGSAARGMSHSIDDDNIVTAEMSMFNPIIFIPELNDIVYGCESWWGEIGNEEELKKLITDDVIGNVWYVKLLTNLGQNDGGK